MHTWSGQCVCSLIQNIPKCPSSKILCFPLKHQYLIGPGWENPKIAMAWCEAEGKQGGGGGGRPAQAAAAPRRKMAPSISASSVETAWMGSSWSDVEIPRLRAEAGVLGDGSVYASVYLSSGTLCHTARNGICNLHDISQWQCKEKPGGELLRVNKSNFGQTQQDLVSRSDCHTDYRWGSSLIFRRKIHHGEAHRCRTWLVIGKYFW